MLVYQFEGTGTVILRGLLFGNILDESSSRGKTSRKPSDYIKALVCGFASPYREEKKIMMLQGFVDDSGSNEPSRVYVLAVYVLPAEKWGELSDKWAIALEKDKRIAYFKRSEAWLRYEGEFAGWTFEERNKKIRELADVVIPYQPLALVVTLRWEDFREYQSKTKIPIPQDNPYFFLFYGLLALMVETGEHFGNSDPVDFTFDEHGEIGLEALSWYGIFREYAPPRVAEILASTPIFRDEKKVVALQTADLLAWYERRRQAKPLEEGSDAAQVGVDISEHAMRSDITPEGCEVIAIDFYKARLKKESQMTKPGESRSFDNFMDKLLKVPHSEIKAKLDAEKEDKKRKRAAKKGASPK